MTSVQSDIANFYKDQTIFLTGATGFLGKAIIEKLLRVCEPKRIYILIRSKKGKEPQQRIEELFQQTVFERLKKERPASLAKLSPVFGDVSMLNLGISEEQQKILKKEVNVVIHAAATVRFDEKLKTAVAINVRGTKELIKLCHDMKSLKSVTHVSTAYSNCIEREIFEEFYKSPMPGDGLILLADCINDEQEAAITKYIIEQQWPNTYPFTKAVAEEIVKVHGKGLPISIFRPAIIGSANEEPSSGWIDNLYGPIGVGVGVGAGIIRVLRSDMNAKAEIIPVDMCVNALLSATYQGALNTNADIPIYNYVSSPNNQITWGDYQGAMHKWACRYPSSKALWYYSYSNIQNRFLYNIYILFLHLIPALLIDLGLLATNNKPRALKIYNKIHNYTEILTYFSFTTWKFHNENVQQLWKSLNDEDKKLFNFDMSQFDWDAYFRISVLGLRKYIFQESEDNLPAARRRFMMMYGLHLLVKYSFFSLIGWCIWKIGLIHFAIKLLLVR